MYVKKILSLTGIPPVQRSAAKDTFDRMCSSLGLTPTFTLKDPTGQVVAEFPVIGDSAEEFFESAAQKILPIISELGNLAFHPSLRDGHNSSVRIQINGPSYSSDTGYRGMPGVFSGTQNMLRPWAGGGHGPADENLAVKPLPDQERLPVPQERSVLSLETLVNDFQVACTAKKCITKSWTYCDGQRYFCIIQGNFDDGGLSQDFGKLLYVVLAEGSTKADAKRAAICQMLEKMKGLPRETVQNSTLLLNNFIHRAPHLSISEEYSNNGKIFCVKLCVEFQGCGVAEEDGKGRTKKLAKQYAADAILTKDDLIKSRGIPDLDLYKFCPDL